MTGIENYLPLVRSIAGKLSYRSPRVDCDDLVSAGMIGLVEAGERFNDAKSDNFAGWASQRIKGACLDLIRTDARSRQLIPPRFTSMSIPIAHEDGKALLLEDILPTPEPEPDRVLENLELREQIITALSLLHESDRLVLSLYYYENLSLDDIASMFGYSRSRASQIKARAVKSLRHHFIFQGV